MAKKSTKKTRRNIGGIKYRKQVSLSLPATNRVELRAQMAASIYSGLVISMMLKHGDTGTVTTGALLGLESDAADIASRLLHECEVRNG